MRRPTPLQEHAGSVPGFLSRWPTEQSSPLPGDKAVPIHAIVGTQAVSIVITVNGKLRPLDVSPATTLLDLLRHDLALSGTKKGCDHGQCGACTVIIDGHRINSCLQLAVMQDGKAITTVEGLSHDGSLHPLQAAFIERDAFQCGYCTPGQLCSGVALIEEGHARTREEIREHMSGNICRCGAYPNIVDAIEDVLVQRGQLMKEAAE
jgi:xanthine dehydrogenase YagT iron-sulfur-binding subunit